MTAARSNPLKKKKRSCNATLLIMVEGRNDKDFIATLKRFYAYNSSLAITIKSAGGGGPDDMVKKAIHFPGDFDKRLVIIDGDKPFEQEQIPSKSSNLELLIITPCLESILLTIFSPKLKVSNIINARDCKKKFQRDILKAKTTASCHDYEKFFKNNTTKSLLEKSRNTTPELNRIISIIEGKE